MDDVKLYPVLELLDLYYGYRYGWLSKLLEVSDTVMLRPEARLGMAFGRGISIKRYLAEKYGVSIETLSNLKIVMDHGIFVNGEDFSKIFGVPKSPESLIKIYDILEVDYGLAYDVPSRLHVEIAVEIALSRILNKLPSDKILKALHPSMRVYVERLADTLSAHMRSGKNLNTIRGLKRRMYELMSQEKKEGDFAELHNILQILSEETVRETLKNLEEQLKLKRGCCKKAFRLIPVVQGLYEEHAMECLINVVDLLINYEEAFIEADKKHVYIAIGTGGRMLSNKEAKMINRLMESGIYYAKKQGIDMRFHVLGWSSPKTAENLRVDLIYSSDSLSARRRAPEGRIYVFSEDGRVRLTHVTNIDPKLWKCPCPVCSDPKLRHLVLDPSGSRKNDIRAVHSLWTIKQYIRLLKEKCIAGDNDVSLSSKY